MKHTERNLGIRRNAIENYTGKFPQSIIDSLWKKFKQDEAEYLREKLEEKQHETSTCQ